MKRIFLIVLVIFSVVTLGQSQKRSGYGRSGGRTQSFLRTQWWLGFTAGANLTQPTVDASYSTFAPINYGEEQVGKTYNGMQLGGQTGLTITFYHRGFSFVTEPNFRTRQFSYFTEYAWNSEANPDNSLELRYDHQVNLQYIDVPVFIRYDLYKGKFRPYVQAGGYYGWLVNAKKTIETSGLDNASGSSGSFQSQEVTLGADEMFTSRDYGVAAGAGTTFDIWNVRFLIGINYRYGLENITNEANRYSANAFTDTGDVMDDISLRGWDASINCVFPLRFISKNLKATE